MSGPSTISLPKYLLGGAAARHPHFPVRYLVQVQSAITFPSTRRAHFFAEHYSMPRGCLPVIFREPQPEGMI